VNVGNTWPKRLQYQKVTETAEVIERNGMTRLGDEIRKLANHSDIIVESYIDDINKRDKRIAELESQLSSL